MPERLDLSPAKWIWFPSQRTLANTFVLFRQEVDLTEVPTAVRGWISADSRYRLYVNGIPVQWGPAPSDPRFAEADPLDLKDFLHVGKNVIGIEVLYYGHGEGTWPIGKPGLLFNLEIAGSATSLKLVSDASWMCAVDRAHRPGQYRRWFLRSLQEEFDARLHPYEWLDAEYDLHGWTHAQELKNPANRPPFASEYWDYANESGVVDPAHTELRKRSIPLLKEELVPAESLRQAGRVVWTGNPEDWFDFRTPSLFKTEPLPAEPAPLQFHLSSGEARYLIFEFKEQIVGWPYFSIDAPAGTIVELITQESHDPAKSTWLDTHFFTWSRFICKEGKNDFHCFDFESLRWLQLHIRNSQGQVRVSNVGVRRRSFPWPSRGSVFCTDTALQRLFDATLNTVNNCAQETCVDGMGRERQQYSGDGSHQLHVVRYAFGEYRLPARFLTTFAKGITPEGYFLDCWPGYDRLARVMEKQVGASYWGPLLDHGVGFVFDAWNHYWESGDLEPAREAFPAIRNFLKLLMDRMGADGLLPVENLGVNNVYIDHQAFTEQKHKKCAFNLYASAMLIHAYAPLAKALGLDEGIQRQGVVFGNLLLESAKRNFWSAQDGTFVNNLPWLENDKEPRYDDRSLATAVLFKQCPQNDVKRSVELLATAPKELGISYPANAVWRYWALGEADRIDVVLRDLRTRWATMQSVVVNNTIGEFWQVSPDSGDQWSHCALAPLTSLYMHILGMKALAPGFAKMQIKPQLADLEHLDVTAHYPDGAVHLQADRRSNSHHVRIVLSGSSHASFVTGSKIHQLVPDREHQFDIPGVKP